MANTEEDDGFTPVRLFKHQGVKYVRLDELQSRLAYVHRLIDRSLPDKAAVLNTPGLKVKDRLVLRAIPNAVFVGARGKMHQIMTYALGEIEEEQVDS